MLFLILLNNLNFHEIEINVFNKIVLIKFCLIVAFEFFNGLIEPDRTFRHQIRREYKDYSPFQ